MENLGRKMEESVMDTNQKDTKTKLDNTLMTKPEDLDGLQMLRLAQEEDKTMVWKDMVSQESIEQPTKEVIVEKPAIISSTMQPSIQQLVEGDDFKPEVIRVDTHISQDDDESLLEEQKADIITDMDPTSKKLLVGEQDMAIRKCEKHKGVEGASIEKKPALVKEPVINLDTCISQPLEEQKAGQQDERLFQEEKAGIILAYVEADVDPKPGVLIAREQEMAIRKCEKQKGVEGAGVERKPALVKKEVSELQGLMERQQKILQDFHVKFVLEGVDVEEDDEARARRHSEFYELKKRLEEEEKMYAGCALGEASDIDVTEKDQIDAEITPRNLTAMVEDIVSSEPADVVVRATMNQVINGLADVAICMQDSSPCQAELKPLPGSQTIRNTMKDLADDDGFSQLQEYTNREGNVGCQCCCRKAGKQIDNRDESDVYMTNSSYSMLNVVCPISGMPVVDLDDPVRSEECEHIYDRASALNYIASLEKDGFCLCASAGCRALLAENKLVADSRLWQDIEELRQIKAALWESRMLQDFVNMDDSDDD